MDTREMSDPEFLRAIAEELLFCTDDAADSTQEGGANHDPADADRLRAIATKLEAHPPE